MSFVDDPLADQAKCYLSSNELAYFNICLHPKIALRLQIICSAWEWVAKHLWNVCMWGNGTLTISTSRGIRNVRNVPDVFKEDGRIHCLNDIGKVGKSAALNIWLISMSVGKELSGKEEIHFQRRTDAEGGQMPLRQHMGHCWSQLDSASASWWTHLLHWMRPG